MEIEKRTNQQEDEQVIVEEIIKLRKNLEENENPLILNYSCPYDEGCCQNRGCCGDHGCCNAGP